MSAEWKINYEQEVFNCWLTRVLKGQFCSTSSIIAKRATWPHCSNRNGTSKEIPHCPCNYGLGVSENSPAPFPPPTIGTSGYLRYGILMQFSVEDGAFEFSIWRV